MWRSWNSITDDAHAHLFNSVLHNIPDTFLTTTNISTFQSLLSEPRPGTRSGTFFPNHRRNCCYPFFESLAACAVAVHRETNIKVAIKVLNKKKVQAVSVSKPDFRTVLGRFGGEMLIHTLQPSSACHGLTFLFASSRGYNSIWCCSWT